MALQTIEIDAEVARKIADFLDQIPAIIQLINDVDRHLNRYAWHDYDLAYRKATGNSGIVSDSNLLAIRTLSSARDKLASVSQLKEEL